MSIVNLVVKIIANKMVAKDHFKMRIEASEISAASIAGQFVMMKPHVPIYDPLIKIPLAIHQKHNDGISVLYRVVGTGTEILSKLQSGDALEILGPLGNGFSVTEHKNNLLVAGGFGAAPLYALAKELYQLQKKMAVFLGAATKNLIICADDFKKLGATIYIATEDGSLGEKGLVTDLLAKHLVNDVMLYASGPNAMLKQIAKIARDQKIPAQLSMEA
jgi:dihydroorotate dehydrogenase electron transfer subunit